jgi:hypothetical protein
MMAKKAAALSTGSATKPTPNARTKGWRQFTVDEVAAALEKSHGLVSFAARLLGCNRSTVYEYLNRHPHLRNIISDAGEALLDKGELALEKAIDGNESWAVQFLLKTKGKKRGYVERQEHTGADGGPMVMSIADLMQGGNDDAR